MNKLQGFYELQKSGLPTVPWKKYDKNSSLDPGVLWTVRSAVLAGDDLNLPRKIGVTAAAAKIFADSLFDQLGEGGLVIYYPYFIAEKSGVLEVAEAGIVIEAVEKDLWNLVTDNKVDISIRITKDDYIVSGREQFLSGDELLELADYAKIIQNKYNYQLSGGKSVFLEWSYAYRSSLEKEPLGDKNLVFYELRSVKR